MPTSYETGWDYDQTDKTWRAPNPTVIPQDARAQANSILPVGMIAPYIGTTAPVGWLMCDGAAIPSQYPALIALAGANTPNLKGVVIAGYDAGQAEFNTLKATGGAKTLTIASGNLPVHTHTLNGHNHGGATTSGGGSSHNHGGTTGSSGGSSHDHGLSNHSHGGGTGIHAHAVTAGLGGGNIGLTAGGSNYNLLEQSKSTNSVGQANTGEGSADTGHTHTTTIGADTAHTHSTVIGGDSSASSNGGFANTALASLPPYMTLNYIIKAA